MDDLTDIPKLPRDTETIPPITRAEKDLQFWHTWKKTQHPQDLRNLLRQFDPIVHKWAGTYAHSGVPTHALEAEAKLNAVKGFKTYDPGKGTQLSTHVINSLQKGQRLVYENRQLTRIPEHRAIRAGTYMSVRDYLKGKLDRDPTLDELHEELGAGHPIDSTKEPAWSKAEIERMEKELHKTLLSSEDNLGDMETNRPSRDSEVLDFLMYDLTNEEGAVYEYLTGRNGKPKLDGIEISKKLQMTPSRVSRIRQRIADKFEKHRNKI